MKIYIHQETGLATTSIPSTTALAKIEVWLGSTSFLDCVFHDGTQAVELDAGATGACVAKQDKQYSAAALVQATAWTKQSATEDGYRFILLPAGDPLIALLATDENVTLDFQIAWSEDGIPRKTQIISLVVHNAVYRDDEPVIEQPGAAWPLPGDLATTAALANALAAALISGDIRIPDRDNNNLLRRLVIKNGELKFEDIVNP